MIRPTRKAALFFSCSVPVALGLAALYPDLWVGAFYFPAAVLLFCGADALMGISQRALHLTVKKPALLYVGSVGQIELHLRSERKTQQGYFEALWEMEGRAGQPKLVGGALKQGELLLTLSFEAKKRGKLFLKAVWLRWEGPLGLVERGVRYAEEAAISVLPDIKGMRDEGLRFFSRSVQHGARVQRLKGEGAEFENLCEFTAGMDNRLIDWKRSAHHRKLLSKEFRQERNHQICFCFDTGRLMLEQTGSVTKLDHALRSALLLGWVALASGDFVGAAAFDRCFRCFLPPSRGIAYHLSFQRFAAALEYHTEESNFALGLTELYGKLPRRSLVVLFTDFVDQISAELLLETLQLLARRHLLVLVTLNDPLLTGKRDAKPDNFLSVAQSVVASDLLRERAIVLERMARMGVHCLNIPANAISSALLNRYLLIKQRGLL